ncbi:MAG: RCC1 repeat-containing protein [Burkholderiales bacterium]|nr:RCC1 repeat-containing protein [Burkholderiales bacterium]
MKRFIKSLALLTCFLSVTVPQVLANPPAVAAGWGHTLAVSADGKALSWGSDNSGQLGLARQSKITTPQRVPNVNIGKTSTSQRLATGTYHSAIVQSDGTVWTWGDNLLGQLGDGTITAHSTPTPVPNLSGVIAASAGYGHTLALRNDGSVWSWGSNSNGELGIGTTQALSLQPVPVWNIEGTPIDSISAGFGHNLATTAGWVIAWGNNSNGQLGDGSTTTWYSPTLLFSLPYITSVSAGVYHSLALDIDGQVWAWGMNGGGRLGDGTTTDRLSPVPVPGLPKIVAIAAGGQHSVALAQDGSVWAWGTNTDGQLGDGTFDDRARPVKVIGLTGIRALNTHNNHNFAVDSSGNLWAWGFGATGQLGDGQSQSSATAKRVAGLGGVVSVAPGYGHSLAVTTDGQLWGWGENLAGQVGITEITDHTVPSALTGLSGLIGVAAGFRHSLALQSDGRVWAWGYNLGGQLGDGTNDSRTSPVLAKGVVDVVQVSAGILHSVARKHDGTVWAWGSNGRGEAGNGTQTLRSDPGPVKGLSGITQLSAGYGYTLAVRSDGTAWGWGDNPSGQLGDGTTISRTSPVQVTGVPKLSAVASGSNHSLGLALDGTVWAWGEQTSGKLGNSQVSPGIASPAKVNGVSNVIAIAAGAAYSLALKSDGTVWIWGFRPTNDGGYPALIPEKVSGLSNITAIAAGVLHMVALRSDGITLSWGYNIEGGLGDGTYTFRPDAVGVVNEPFTALLDLDTLQANLPLDANKVPPFFVVTQKTGSKRNTSLQADLRGLLSSTTVRSANLAHAGVGYNVYVAASMLSGSQVLLFQLNSAKQWGVLNWPMAEYLRGVALDSQDTVIRTQILEDTDLSALAGAQIHLGFGVSADEMLSSGRFRTIFTVPKD